MLEIYEWAIKVEDVTDPDELHQWRTKVGRVEKEMQIWGNFAHAIGDSMLRSIAKGKVF